jgi:hypothetical protein
MGSDSAGSATVELDEKGQTSDSVEPTASDIALRAYELFEARGGEHGAAFAYEDWLQAERELRVEKAAKDGRIVGGVCRTRSARATGRCP